MKWWNIPHKKRSENSSWACHGWWGDLLNPKRHLRSHQPICFLLRSDQDEIYPTSLSASDFLWIWRIGVGFRLAIQALVSDPIDLNNPCTGLQLPPRNLLTFAIPNTCVSVSALMSLTSTKPEVSTIGFFSFFWPHLQQYAEPSAIWPSSQAPDHHSFQHHGWDVLPKSCTQVADRLS